MPTTRIGTVGSTSARDWHRARSDIVLPTRMFRSSPSARLITTSLVARASRPLSTVQGNGPSPPTACTLTDL
jgi:hypothetical protein